MKNVLFAIAFASSLNVGAQVFSTPVVMESPGAIGGLEGEYNSLEIINGRPAIAYYDRVHTSLMFRRALDASGNQWGTAITVDNKNDAGSFCDMKIVNGLPAIAYIEATYNRVMYVQALDPDGNNWATPVIVDDTPTIFPQNTNLEIVNGKPAITFWDLYAFNTIYIRSIDLNGNAWGNLQIIGSGGIDVTLVVANGRPCVAYSRLSPAAVVFQHANDSDGVSWATPTVITPMYADEITCTIAFGKPMISYSSQSNYDIVFIRALDTLGTVWTSPVVLDPGTDFHVASMMHSGSRVMITYMDYTTELNWLLVSSDSIGNTWTSPVIVNNSSLGFYNPDINMVNGVPAISNWNGHLHFFTANDATGSSWNQPVVFNSQPPSGTNISMCVIGGAPAAASIKHYDPFEHIMFHRSYDPFGQNWDTIRGIIQVGTNAMPSIQVIGSTPAIAFTKGFNNLKVGYIRSLDSVGQTWSSPTKVDSTFNASNCQLLNLNGIPAIAYFDSSTYRIRFTRANNQNGTSWSPSFANFPSSTVKFDFAIINGKPALAYINTAGNAIVFTIANDSLGATWSVPINVVNIAGLNSPPALENVNGFPAIVYKSPTSSVVTYVRALNNNGSAWALPIVPSVTALGGSDPTLYIHDGRPVISYVGNLNERMFIASANMDGTSWSTEVFLDSTRSPFLPFSSDVVSANGYVGVGYDQPSDKFAYYSSACVGPFNPGVASVNPVCDGSTVTLSAMGYGTLSWYNASSGGTYLGSGTSFTTPSLSSTTTYYVQDSTCAASTRTAVTVTVNPLPTISLAGNLSYCSGDSTTLSVNGSGDGFEWSTGSLAMSESFSPSVTTSEWVMTYDGAGCTDTIFFTINVTQPQTTTQTIAICDGDSYTVGSNSYSVAGTYTDSLATVQLGCDSIVLTTITVQPNIDTTLSYSNGILSSNETGAVYQWINCTTQQTINGATNQSYTPTQNGTYAAVIVNGPCTDTSTCYPVTDVGISENISGNAVMIVNVNAGEINSTLQHAPGVISFEYYNALGELVYSVSAREGDRVTYQTQVPGMYVVKATFGGTTVVKRVVAQ